MRLTADENGPNFSRSRRSSSSAASARLGSIPSTGSTSEIEREISSEARGARQDIFEGELLRDTLLINGEFMLSLIEPETRWMMPSVFLEMKDHMLDVDFSERDFRMSAAVEGEEGSAGDCVN
jgi:hypothetical protein